MGNASDNTQVDIKVDDVLFSVPAMYFTHLMSNEHLGKVNEYILRAGVPKGFDFAFWMPSGRPEKIKTIPPMVIPELIARGARIADDEYPIVVLHTRIVSPSTPDFLPPRQMLANLSRAEGNSEDETIEIFGLKKTVYGADSIRNFDEYSLISNELDVMIGCYNGSMPYPNCKADVYFRKDGISCLIFFPTKNLPDWKAILDKVKDLINTWRKP